MRIRNLGGGGEVCNVADPPEGDLQWKGEDLQCCKPSPLGKVCNVAMLLIFGEKVSTCNVADILGGGGGVCKGERSAIQHRHTITTYGPSDGKEVITTSSDVPPVPVSG